MPSTLLARTDRARRVSSTLVDYAGGGRDFAAGDGGNADFLVDLLIA